MTTDPKRVIDEAERMKAALVKPPPEYKTFPFKEVAEALAEIRRQHEAGEPLVWTGPEKLHHAVAATSPEPAWHFSPEGLEYMAERDHDFWEVYTLVAFQIGYHNGTVREEENSGFWKRMAEAKL